VQIEISTRHAGLDAEQHRYLHEKAEKLLKYFGRLMAIEVAVDHVKHAWDIEILVSAEHKHDFVARESGSTPETAMDACVHKIEQQLRRSRQLPHHGHLHEVRRQRRRQAGRGGHPKNTSLDFLNQ